MKQQDRSALVQISAVFGTLTRLTARGCSEKGHFRHLSNDIVHSIEFRKYSSYGPHLFLETSEIFCRLKNCIENSTKIVWLFRYFCLN